MMLDVSPAIEAALESDNITFAWLVDLDSGVWRWTTHGTDLVVSGDTYHSLGNIISLQPIVRERDIKLQSYTMRFSGAERTLADQLRLVALTGIPCVISLVLIDGDGDVVGGEALRLYKGAVHAWSEDEGGDAASVEIQITSPWSKPSQTSGRLTSTDAQEDRYAGDKFFEFAHVEKSNIGWGGEA
ncbi:hypothetical protein [Kordiimonas sp.]|uniref:hypothetical protein n=2 Tax=Kordiimonas sp. TaxID=1970157 RepID=UPI003B52E42E